MPRMLTVVAILLLISPAVPAVACLWDSDTLLEERSRFPTTLELITGKFLRHSREFYQWRVRDRKRRLEKSPSDPALYDDLAVAYEKLGNHQQAIALMLEKEQKFPGKYETYANLGTFYIHAGQLEAGLEQLARAVAINPAAHFGREVYQQRLVEYVRSKRKDGVLRFPLAGPKQRMDDVSQGFDVYVMEAAEVGASRSAELKKAVKGVLGMMRFGNYDSPILLEALGDLLLGQGNPSDGKQLAARAYLKASYEVKDEEAQKAYRTLAARALALQLGEFGQELSLDSLEEEFQKELAEADEWYAAVRSDEQQWIAAGKNPEQEFEKKYRAEPRQSRRGGLPLVWFALAILAVGGMLVLAALWMLRRKRIESRQTLRAVVKPLADAGETAG